MIYVEKSNSIKLKQWCVKRGVTLTTMVTTYFPSYNVVKFLREFSKQNPIEQF